MIRFLAATLAAVVVICGGAQGQDDPMEVQRCVWRCLAGPGGGDATSPAYSACVAELCEPETYVPPVAALPPAPAQPLQAAGWTVSRGTDGRLYAGIAFPFDGLTDQAAAVWLYCVGTDALIGLQGIDGPPMPMRFAVDGQEFRAPMTATPSGWIVAGVPAGSAFRAALMSGGQVNIKTDDGTTVLVMPMAGAAQAIAMALGGC